MKQKAKELLKHPLVYGSSIVIVGNLVANFFNFLFNLFMSRNLSIAEYGTLASVVALMSFPSLAVGAIVPMVIHFSGKYFATGHLEMIRGLYLKLIRFLFVIGIGICILFLLLIPQISSFFHINDIGILLVTDASIFIIIMTVINTALIQAKMAFFFQVLMNISGSLLKFIAGALLVFAGFAVGGAVTALFISFLIAYVVSFFPIRFIFEKKIIPVHIETKELFDYGIPSAITLIALTSFISADIILVKHFFPANLAGIYAGLSLVGRVIFYISAPIGTVMFPLIVQKYSRNENFTNTFKISLLLVLLPSIALILFYYFFPDFTIVFFLKKVEYLAANSLLWLFGVFIALYSLLTIIANFFLSIKKTNIFIPIGLAAIAQIIFICFYHQTFFQVIMVSIIITFLLVVGLLLYYPYAIKRQV